MFSSFRAKVILITVGLVCIGQATLFTVIFANTNSMANEQIKRELRSGSNLFHKLIEDRSKKLLDTTRILTADFGFKQAVATSDAATVRSALNNHGGRINADVVLLVSLDGTITASTSENVDEGTAFPFPDLIESVTENSQANSLSVLKDKAYQVVMLPVYAPDEIAWVFMGFAIDEKLAESLKSLTGLETSFWNINSNKTWNVVSTLTKKSQDASKKIVSLNNSENRLYTISLEGDEHLTLSEKLFAGENTVIALLQKSRAQALAIYHKAWKSMGIMAICTLLASIFIAIMISRYLAQPIRLLSMAANRIEKGDYQEPITLKRKDELGKLMNSFNAMQGGIAEREEQILHQSHYDLLTGLPNRVLAVDRLEKAIQRAQRHEYEVQVLLLDLNNFKDINDTMGHHVGDIVLKEVAKRLSKRIRKLDTVARLGGDEYLLVLDDVTLKQAKIMAIEISNTIKDEIELGKANVSVGASIGISAFPHHGDQPDELLRRADIAMYDAKDSHHDVVIYESGRDQSYARAIRINSDIVSAIENDEFELHYQPKINMNSQTVKHAEALIRWIHPEFGFLPPDEFINIAEKSGSIVLVTNWVLNNAIRQISKWKKQGISLNIAINLSPIDLVQKDFVENIRSSLKRYSVQASNLTFEITENAVMNDIATSLNVLQEIKVLGSNISIDDFGTGYSSLSQLKHMPVSEIKIDKSFVMKLSEISDDISIVRSIIDLGHNMNLKVVAEGVEDKKSWDILNNYSCDFVQGYYISKPLKVEDFTEWYLSNFMKPKPQELVSELKVSVN